MFSLSENDNLDDEGKLVSNIFNCFTYSSVLSKLLLERLLDRSNNF